jgi:23S rRNA (cytidine1920-2'-O)/16S rRNA (cytidine1409-2'-O)-methyltransferase
MAKERLDVLMVARGLAESRERAQRLVRAGLVYTGGQRLEKPGVAIDTETPLTVRGSDCPYVSRGGLKLAGALDALGVAVQGRVCLDLGASTGGFTDCLLQRGAARVHAIDVGRGQLHDRIARNPRVSARERTHIDMLAAADFAEPPDLAVADLSFISVTRAFVPLRRVMPRGEALVLVKPQFELGRERVPRGGVVRDDALRRDAIDGVAAAARAAGFEVAGEADSPIEGGDGNRETFLWLRW